MTWPTHQLCFIVLTSCDKRPAMVVPWSILAPLFAQRGRSTWVLSTPVTMPRGDCMPMLGVPVRPNPSSRIACNLSWLVAGAWRSSRCRVHADNHKLKTQWLSKQSRVRRFRADVVESVARTSHVAPVSISSLSALHITVTVRPLSFSPISAYRKYLSYT